MVEYSPRPDRLENLNVLQRYMQKGHLDRQDYAYLLIFVLAYFSARPYIQKFFKWAMAPKEFTEGEAAQKEYFDSKKPKVGANSIRGSEKVQEVDESEPVTVAGSGDGAGSAAVTGSSVGGRLKGATKDGSGKVVNRKQKGVSFAPEKTEEEKLLDWDDEPIHPVEQGEKGDIVQWLDKWDK